MAQTVGLLGDLTLAPVAYQTTARETKTVAVGPLAGTIAGATATHVTSMLQQARGPVFANIEAS